MTNITYKTSHLAEYFLQHRRSWDEFYPSERWVFDRIGASAKGFGRVLDVGCAVGGLGNALTEKFSIDSYVGIDINAQAIDAANSANQRQVPTRYICGDIVDCTDIADQAFDTVTSLSVADWNVDTNAIIHACWKKVAPGGRLIITLRLTNEQSVNNLDQSYQYIVPHDEFEIPDDKSGLERAPYVVLNVHETLRLFSQQSPAPSDILAYGFWGTPSATAQTPFAKVVFAVLAITKPERGDGDPMLECHLPTSVFL